METAFFTLKEKKKHATVCFSNQCHDIVGLSKAQK